MRKILFILLLLFAISGCVFTSSTLSTPEETVERIQNRNTVTPSSNTLATEGVTPSSLSVTPAPFLASTPYPSPTPGLFQQQCITIGDEVQIETMRSSGNFILRDEQGRYYRIDVGTGEKSFLPLKFSQSSHVYSVLVSPDRKHLFYVEETSDSLSYGWYLSIDNTNQINHVWQKDWVLPEWLNNEKLVVYSNDSSTSAYVLDLLSGQITQLSVSFPDLYDDKKFQASWKVKYSPDLRLAIYLNLTPGIVLWDLVKKEMLWEEQDELARLDVSYNLMTAPPQWSSDGEKIAYVLNHHLHIVDRTGKMNIVLSLEKSPYKQIAEIRWSPDNRLLAFLGVVEETDYARLLVYKLDTNQVTDFCIGTDWMGASPLWSPDSRQIIFYTQKNQNPGEYQSQTILLDLEKQNAVRLDAIPLEWAK